jgi:hypothetical protein
MKDWVRHIQDWAGWTVIREWDGWRRYTPAAGSVAAHAVVGLAVVSIMAASVKPRPAVPSPPSPDLQITLVSETPRPAPRPPPPRRTPPPRPAPDAQAIPETPRTAPRKEDKRSPEAAITPDEDTVFVPPSILLESIPLGLRGMMDEDRCNPRKGLRPRNCDTQNWAGKIPPAQGWQVASKEELKQYYGAFMQPCPYKVGCEPGEWKSSNGTRSVAGSAMAGGAAGLTSGAEGTTGRLGFNPDHTDPAFGD